MFWLFLNSRNYGEASNFRLLDILAGRKDPLGLEGHVLVNGKKQPKNFKALTGYVVQVSFQPRCMCVRLETILKLMKQQLW